MAEETNGLRFRAGPGHVVTTAQQIPMSITATEATFDIESVEIKTCHTPKPIPGSLWAVFLKIFNLTNVVAYLVCLFANILAAHRQGQTGLLVPLLFAVSQIFEHFSFLTESLWRLCVAANRDPNQRPVLRLLGDNVPGAVIIIVACGEPVDIIMDTVNAACRVDYPTDKLLVLLADDGNSRVLHEQVKALSKHFPNLHYTSRDKPAKGHGYKAGNINTALQQYVTKIGFAYEWFCVLDADMIPEPHILRTLLPHGIRDPSIGMVTTGQHFYNVPTNDPLYQSNITGTHAEDGARDSVGTAWCPGSGHIIRASAWIDIGYLPEFAVVEDLFTSWYLHGAGWKTALVHEKLQWGVQPDCLVVHMKQRRRWWTGHMPCVINTNLSLSDPKVKAASFVQRWAMFQHCLRPFNNTVNKVISLSLVAVCLFLRGKVIATPNVPMFLFILASVVIQRLGPVINTLKTVERDMSSTAFDKVWNNQRRSATNIWLGLHFAIDTLKAILPEKAGGKNPEFEVTGVREPTAETANERDALTRLPLLARLKVFQQKEHIGWHLVTFITMTNLLLWNFMTVAHDFTNDAFWFQLFCSVGFPGLALIELVPFLVTPFIYAIFPPTMPRRRELMDQDPKTGIWRPKESAKKMKWTSKGSAWLVIPQMASFICMVIIVLKLVAIPWIGLTRLTGNSNF